MKPAAFPKCPVGDPYTEAAIKHALVFKRLQFYLVVF